MKTICMTLLLCLMAAPVTSAASSQLPENWTFEEGHIQEWNTEANTEISTDSRKYNLGPQNPEKTTSGRVVELDRNPSGLDLDPISPTEIVLIPDSDDEEWSDEPDAVLLPEVLDDGGEESAIFREAVLMGANGCSLTSFSSSAVDPSWMLMLILGFPWSYRRMRK